MSQVPLDGSCLCHAVTFHVDGKYSDIGHCHCSKCRKVSGTGSNAVVLTSSRGFAWTSGEELIQVYETETGWKSTFCAQCGCPLPMLGAGGKLYWIPVGALDSEPDAKVAQHIWVGSRANWDHIHDGLPQHDEAAPSR